VLPWMRSFRPAGCGKLRHVRGAGATASVKPSAALKLNRTAVREAVGRHRATNPRVFGAVRLGTDRDGSDLDLLVDALPGATLFDLGRLQVESEEILGVPVDRPTPGNLPQQIRDRLLDDPRPV